MPLLNSRSSKSNEYIPTISSEESYDDVQPMEFKLGPVQEPKDDEGTSCRKLYAFIEKHKLDRPEFHNFHRINLLNATIYFISNLKIGDLIFASVENESLSYVQEQVAEIALKKLSWLIESEASVLETIGATVDDAEKKANVTESVDKLPSLKLPEFDPWKISVTVCLSTDCVYFRFINGNYQAQYDQLTKMLKDSYSAKNRKSQPVKNIKKGNHYAVRFQDKWHRVKVVSANLKGKVRVLMVDHGDTREISRKCIFPLVNGLDRVPLQVMKCHLTGLKKYYKNEYVTHLVCSMVNNHTESGYTAKVHSREPLKLTLFDIPSGENIRVNSLNAAIKKQIDIELATPTISDKTTFEHVYLTQLEENGHAHVQIVHNGLKLLESVTADIQRDLANHEPKYRFKSVSDLVGQKIVLAKYAGDQRWYRGVIKSLLEEEELAEIHFIDYGDIGFVPIEQLAGLRYFPGVLSAIPPQAVEVDLIRPTHELFTESIIKFVLNLTHSIDDEGRIHKALQMRVIRNGSVPVVELFVRDNNRPDHLVPLNDLIGSLYPPYRTPDFSKTKMNLGSILNPCEKTILLKGIVPHATIPPFPLPEIGSKIHVYVSMFTNPNHFIVQPLDQKADLEKMMENMELYYSRMKPTVCRESIRIGDVFAVKSEKKWYRGLVVHIFVELGEVSFKCLDYGHILIVNSNEIYPLASRFQTVPAQAIKAELAGIAPIRNSWRTQDSYRFRELLSGKKFVGVIMEASKDNIVSLALQDVSKNLNIDMAAVLVKEGRAIDVTVQ